MHESELASFDPYFIQKVSPFLSHITTIILQLSLPNHQLKRGCENTLLTLYAAKYYFFLLLWDYEHWLLATAEDAGNVSLRDPFQPTAVNHKYGLSTLNKDGYLTASLPHMCTEVCCHISTMLRRFGMTTVRRMSLIHW
jgi:hypothetical protein